LSGTHFLEKGGAIAAIFICIGVATGPGLTGWVVTASSRPDPFEVTVEISGTKGYRPYTISLPMQQYQMLTRYLDGLMERINRTSSQDEVVDVIQEAIVEIHTYGLLPKGMSVSHALTLVEGHFHHPQRFSRIELSRLTRWRANPELKNSFCAVFAIASKIPGYTPDPLIIPLGLLLVFGLLPALIVSILGQDELATQLAELGVSLWMKNPLRWFNFVIFHGYEVEFRSIGLKGLVHETLNTTGVFWGFTGLMVSLQNEKTYFLGYTFSIYGTN
jgi:hypothetical protein